MAESYLTTKTAPVIVYSDVDGTLVTKSNEVHPLTSLEIREWMREGYCFSIATGRSLSGVKRLLQEIPVNAPIVLCNGAYIYDPYTHKAVWTSIDSEIAYRIVSQLFCIPSIWIYIECADQSLYVSHSDALTDPFLIKEGIQPNVVGDLKDVLERTEVIKIGIKMLEVNRKAMLKMRGYLNYIQLFHASVDWCFSSDDYIEVLPAGVSKWSGIRASLQMCGKQNHIVCAIGDHLNDLEMIRHSHLGVAMKNAVDEVRNAADRIIGHVEECAVARFLAETRSNFENRLRKLG